jgi:hypothetical protein
MTATTVERVPRQTSAEVNRRIRQQTEARIRYYAINPTGIDARLRELDEEWDIERVLETNASALAFTGVALGILRHKRWLVLSALVTAFLFQHAIEGWCPPIPVLRRLGYRTAREIDIERSALKALRGDFGPIGPGAGDHDSRASHALQAARL